MNNYIIDHIHYSIHWSKHTIWTSAPIPSHHQPPPHTPVHNRYTDVYKRQDPHVQSTVHQLVQKCRKMTLLLLRLVYYLPWIQTVNVNHEVWCKEWLKKRTKFSHVNLLNELRFAPKHWHNYLRMNEQTYFILLEKVAPLIQKKDTVLRPSISAHER